MRKDVIKWLEDNDLGLEKLIQKWKLNGSSILEAAEIIYTRAVLGKENIKKIKIGWELKALSQSIEKSRDAQKVHTITTAMETINELNTKLIVERKMARDKIIELEEKISILKYAFLKRTGRRIKKVCKFIKDKIMGLFK
jgi:ribosomal protein S6